MGAIFFKPNESKGVFRGNFPVNYFVDCKQLNSLFSNTAAESYFTVVTDLGIENNETIQFFLSFDDFINYFYFGKGIGSIALSGMIFTDCVGNMPGLNNLF